jgi:hypothetical protein
MSRRVEVGPNAASDGGFDHLGRNVAHVADDLRATLISVPSGLVSDQSLVDWELVSVRRTVPSL